jgi:hypothetical protein
MATTQINIKIGVETQVAQLRAMEAQLTKQIVQMRTLGETGKASLVTLEGNLGKVRKALDGVRVSTGNSFGGIGRIAGQAGYQIQDFTVQVAGGQNALIAFAQQGSQLAGIFGPYGAMAGAALSIGAVAANFLFMRDSAKDTKAETKALADETKRVADEMARVQEMTRQNTSKLAGISGPDTNLYKGVRESQLLAEMAASRKEASDLDALAATRKLQAENRFANGTINEAERNRLLKEGNELTMRARYAEQAFAAIVAELNSRKEAAAARAVQDLEDEHQIQKEAYDLETARAAEGEKLAAQQDKDIEAQEKALTLAREKAAEFNAQRGLSIKLAASNEQIRRIEDNPYLLNNERDAAKAIELRKQNEAIAEQIDLLERQQQAKGSDPTRQGQIDTLRGQSGVNNYQIDKLTNKPTVEQGFLAGTVEYLKSIPTAAQRAQQSMMGVAQAMQQGIGSSLRGLIDGTMTWGSALANIGNAIVNSILQSFVDMVAGWIVSHTIMATIKKAFAAEDLGTTVATEGAKTAAVTTGEGIRVGAVAASTAASTGIVTAGAAAQTAATGPAAVFRSIMELGPIAGPVTFAAIIGGMLALVSSMAGHKDGGYISGPGTGTSDSIAAWLSNGEYVMPADKTAKYRPLLDAMRDGNLEPPSSNGGGGGMGGGGVTVVNNFNIASGTTRAEVAALIPEIVRRTKASVRDDQRRGKA